MSLLKAYDDWIEAAMGDELTNTAFRVLTFPVMVVLYCVDWCRGTNAWE